MRRAGWHGTAAILAAGYFGSVGVRAEGSLNPMALLDKATLADFVQRPLFDPARRLPPDIPPPPPVVDVQPVVAIVQPPPNLRLIGVIHGPQDMAVVRRDDDHTIILRTGEQVNGWTVTVRPPNGITLKNGERASDFALFTGPAAGVDPAGAAGPPGNGGPKAPEVHAANVEVR